MTSSKALATLYAKFDKVFVAVDEGNMTPTQALYELSGYFSGVLDGLDSTEKGAVEAAIANLRNYSI